MSLTVRKFDGKLTDKEVIVGKDDKGKDVFKSYEYVYPRIVLPWSRTGKDIDGAEVVGTTPSLSEVLSWAQSSGFSTEIKIENDVPAGPSVVAFLVEGINLHLNRTAASEVKNTEESALEAAIQVFMKKRNCTREAAKKVLEVAFR